MTERLHFDFSLSCIGEGNDNPLQYSCLENPKDGGAWWAAVYGVAQSQTRLKRLSSSGAVIVHSTSSSGLCHFIWLCCIAPPNNYNNNIVDYHSKYNNKLRFWILQTLLKCDQSHKINKYCWKNNSERLAQCNIATNFQSVKLAVSAKCIKWITATCSNVCVCW